MSEYLITLIGMSTLVSVVGMIAPMKAKKYTRLVCTLCLLCVILKPLPEIFDSEIFSPLSSDASLEENGGDESFYRDIYNNTVREASAQSIAEGLETMMIKDLGLPAGDFEVRVEIDGGEEYVKVNKASVLLSEGAVAKDPKKIVSYLEEMLACKCEIIYI